MAKYTDNWLQVSKQRAIEQGYEPMEAPEAYGGEVFIKDDLKWIHSIERLKSRLGVTTDVELKELGYAVKDYYCYNSNQETRSHEDIIASVAQEFDVTEILKIFGSDGGKFPKGFF